MSSPTHLAAWQALTEQRKDNAAISMASLFEQDPQRAENFRASAAGWTLDYSKNRADKATMSLLIQLAKEAGLNHAISAMFAGEKINNTENRSVLHTALRASQTQETLLVDGVNVLDEVRDTLKQMEKFVWQLQTGQWRGYSNKRITDVVSIGIGEIGRAHV